METEGEIICVYKGLVLNYSYAAGATNGGDLVKMFTGRVSNE